ncbi:MAG: NnrU family protein [Pseudomonadota bacterium]
MTTLIAGLVLFLGIHSISIVSPSGRDALAAKFGEIGWKILYGLISAVGLYLIIKGYAAARLDPTLVWVPPTWTRHLAALLNLPIFVFFLASYLPGRISKALKHPQLVAVKAWALAHLIANGMLHDMLLFGAFLAWAVADRISMKRRKQRERPQAPESGINDVIAVVGGLAAYGAFAFWAHLAWIGVAPFG